MTVEEKISHIREAAMEEARARGNEIIDQHQKALDDRQWIPDRHGTGRKKDFITSYVNEAIGLKL